MKRVRSHLMVKHFSNDGCLQAILEEKDWSFNNFWSVGLKLSIVKVRVKYCIWPMKDSVSATLQLLAKYHTRRGRKFDK